MPYASEAQRKFFNANRADLEAQGVDVDEWNSSSRGKKLPKRRVKKNAALRLGPANNRFLRQGFVPKPLSDLTQRMPQLLRTNPELAREVVDLNAALYKLRAQKAAELAGMLPRGAAAAKPKKALPKPSIFARLFGGFNKTASFNDIGRALARI